MIKILGRTGVELVLEDEGALAAVEDPPSYLAFPHPNLLVGITAAGAVLAWDLSQGGRRCDHLPPCNPAENVTTVHCPDTPVSAPVDAAGSAAVEGSQQQRYIYLGLESGSVRVVQVSPSLRVSGYVLTSRDIASGAPEELHAPGGGDGYGDGVLGAVTAIASSGGRDGGALVLLGHRHGAIVLWELVRRKRITVTGLSAIALHSSKQGSDGDGGNSVDDEDREVTSLAFHPSMEEFAAGFSCGCYALFPTSSSRDLGSPRWVSEVGDDGSFPREGPTIVRTPVSLVQWVRLQSAWGLLVAGGVEIDEGEEPDGVSLLVTSSDSVTSGVEEQLSSGRRRGKKHNSIPTVLETAVFVPFAIGQERLSCVHGVVLTGGGVSGGDGPASMRGDSSQSSGSGEVIRPALDASAQRDEESRRVTSEEEEGEKCIDVTQELVVMGLVNSTEEVRGADGRLRFRRISSIQACPIQIAPYVALLQLRPERLGSHPSGFAPVTKVASTPLLSSSTILNFVACLGAGEKAGSIGQVDSSSSSLLRGGGIQWAESVPTTARDEALCTSEMLVAGHANGTLTFWECYGPASRSDGVHIADGRMEMRDVPSGASLLGSLAAAELAGDAEGAASAVTALDVWIERDHVAAAERDACWVAVGFDSGEAVVLILSSRVHVSNGDSRWGGGGVGGDQEGSAPVSDRPVVISNVEISDGDSGGAKAGWKGLLGRGVGVPAVESEYVDKELEDAIAEARAEALTIQAQGEGSAENDESRPTGSSVPLANNPGMALDTSEKEGIDGTQVLEPHEHLLQPATDGSEGGVVEATAESSSLPPVVSSEGADDREAEAETQQSALAPHAPPPREASLVQLALRLHGHAVRCVALSFDTSVSALALVVADAEGVVSITDVATGAASLLPMRAPQMRPCYPSIAIGPLPRALAGGTGRTGRQPQTPVKHGTAGALFVLLEGWLNVFDLASRDPVGLVAVPGLAPEHGVIDGEQGGNNVNTGLRTGAAEDPDRQEETWIFCVDERGVPLAPYASEPLSTFTPSPAHRASFADEGNKAAAVDGGGSAGQQNEGTQISGQKRSETTIWVSPSAARTAVDGYHEHELQMLSDRPPARPFFLVVRGAVAVVLAVDEREATTVMSAFQRRPSGPDPNVAAAFKGKSNAELVVKSRTEMPPATGRGLPPRVDRAGVCMVAAGAGGGVTSGKIPRRGCLIATDISGFVTGLLLPSLLPVFRDRLPLGEDGSVQRHPGPSQAALCNLVGELTICDGAVSACCRLSW